MPGYRTLFLYTVLLTLCQPAVVAAFPGDGEVIDSLFCDAVLDGLAGFRPEPGKTVQVAMDAPFGRSGAVRAVAEAALSSAGFVLAGEDRQSGYRVNISVKEISRTLVRNGAEYDRRVGLSAHFTCSDRSGTVFLARMVERQHADRIPRSHLESTDSEGTFRGILGPRVVIGNPRTIRIVSFAGISVLLAWLAFRE